MVGLLVISVEIKLGISHHIFILICFECSIKVLKVWLIYTQEVTTVKVQDECKGPLTQRL